MSKSLYIANNHMLKTAFFYGMEIKLTDKNELLQRSRDVCFLIATLNLIILVVIYRKKEW